MFKMKKRSYRVFEGLRVATLVSYIGGFIDAYTYNTQDERFASIQTGNLLYLVIHLVEGNIARAFSYAIPIFFFYFIHDSFHDCRSPFPYIPCTFRTAQNCCTPGQIRDVPQDVPGYLS